MDLACRLNGEIINGDAMQLYHGLPIITNKITTEERKGVSHHLLGRIGLEEETWTVGKFVKNALVVVKHARPLRMSVANEHRLRKFEVGESSRSWSVALTTTPSLSYSRTPWRINRSRRRTGQAGSSLSSMNQTKSSCRNYERSIQSWLIDGI